MPGEAAPVEAAPGEVVVYAEGTRAQFKAVLAGLEAQPDVFLAIAVEPAQGQTPQDGFAQAPQRPAAGQGKSPAAAYQGKSPAAAGQRKWPAMPTKKIPKKRREPRRRVGKDETVQGPGKAGQPQAGPEAAGGGQGALGGFRGALEPQRDGRSAKQRQMRQQSRREQVDQSTVPRQRIVFVLRVVGGGRPAAPREASQAAGQKER